MNKKIMLLTLPLLATPFTSCNRAAVPTGLEIIGLDSVMHQEPYKFVAGLKSESEVVNTRVEWTVDKPELAYVYPDGTLVTSKVEEPTELTITAKSRVNEEAKDSKKITIYPGTPLSNQQLVKAIYAQETKLYNEQASKIEEGKTYTVNCTLDKDDFVLGFKGNELKVDPEKPIEFRMQKIKDVSDMLATSFRAVFKTPKSNETQVKSFDSESSILVYGLLKTYDQLEKAGCGAYNCFSFDSTGKNPDNHDSFGYYNYYNDDGIESFKYRVFRGGAMCDVIDVKNGKVSTKIHYTPKFE